MSDTPVIDPNTNLPRPIYLIAKSGTFICMRPTEEMKYDKFYFNQSDFVPGQRMDPEKATRVKHVTLTNTTVFKLWPDLVKNQGYKYM